MKPKAYWKDYLKDEKGYDFSIAKEAIDELSLEHFIECAERAMDYGFTDGWAVFPTGPSVYVLALDDYLGTLEISETSDWYLPEKAKPGTAISLRNYCGRLELLVTDRAGNHWLYNKINGLPAAEVIAEYWREIELLRPFLGGVAEDSFDASSKRMSEQVREALDSRDPLAIYPCSRKKRIDS